MSHEFRLTTKHLADGLPALQMAADDLPTDAPVALVLHGLGSRKEKMLPALLAFAASGFRAVAFDAPLHGERPGADEREQRLETAFAPTVYEMIAGTTADISRVLDVLDAPRAAVLGISLGGMTTFAAMLSEPRLAAVTVAMGTPDWAGLMRSVGLGPGHPHFDALAPRSPLEHAAASYPPRPLLLLHGDEDLLVPVSGTLALYDRLVPAYADAPDRLELVVYPAHGHVFSDDMLTRSVNWSRRFL